MARGIYDYAGEPRVAFEDDVHYLYSEDIVRADYDVEPVPPENRLEVMISGGSMGGLFTAYGLSQAGHHVNIYEKTAPGDMKGRGAGIVLFPELLEYMERHGLADREEVGLTLNGVQYLAEDGGVRKEFDWSVHTTSWDTTYRSLRREFPDDRYHMAKETVEVEWDGESMQAAFSDGERVQSDLLVVAEGYRSDSRRQLLPEVTLDYAGYVAWRALRPAGEIDPAVRDRFMDKMVYFNGPDYQINGYSVPSPEGSTNPEDRRINLVWYAKVAPEELDEVLLDRHGNRRDGSIPPGYMREKIWERQIEEARRSEIPDVFVDLLLAYDEPYLQCIYDLATHRMVVDRACVIGDSAFFIRPHMAAGTSHAAADGLSLAEALGPYDELTPTLERWETRRLEQGQHLVDRAKDRGDRFLQL